MKSKLTRDERQCIELVPPLFRDFDSVRVVAFLLRRHAQFGSVLDELGDIVAGHCVKDVPEVAAIGQAAFGGRVGHVDHKVFDFLHEWPEFFDTELIVFRDMHVLHLTQSQKLFLLNEHELYEIFIEHFLRRNVELQLLFEVLNKIVFASESCE